MIRTVLVSISFVNAFGIDRGYGIFSSPLQRPTGAAGCSEMVGNGPMTGTITRKAEFF
jgi:hypothetical protein